MLRLKELREDHDFKQSDISELLGISQTNYSKYELEKVNLPIEALIKLSKIYKTSTDYILGLTDVIVPYPSVNNKSRTKYGRT